MAWNNHGRSWDLPRLTNYADASRREAETKPIRGDADGTKPLGDRKKKWFNIRREGDDVILKAHRTDVVRFKPDGDVVINNGGWVSPTTHDFFTIVLGLYTRTFDSKTWATCYFQPDGFVNAEPTHGQFVIPNNTDITITRYQNSWLTKHMQAPSTHKVNRIKANIFRKDYVPFKRYMTGILKLRTETQERTNWRAETYQEKVLTITRQELVDNGVAVSWSDVNSGAMLMDGFRPRSDGLAQNLRGMMLSGDPARQYKAFLIIARSSTHGYISAHNDKIFIDPDVVLSFYQKLILFIHKNEVLEKTAGSVAKAKRDPFGNWF
jgi:hypothetical protein